jgi:radical SAM protein with 4Fe4S-binding SPASM domain
MDFDLFRKIIDETAPGTQFQQVNLYGLGEPYLHPECETLIDYAVKGYGSFGKTVTIITNGAVTTRFPEDVGHVDISVNASTKNRYEELTGQSFERTVNNISRLNAEGALRHNVDIHMLCSEETAAEMEGLLELFGDTSGNIEFSFKYENQCGLVPDKTLKRYRTAARIPCHYLLEELTVTWDGKVILCPHDYDGRVCFGDLRTQSIRETWQRFLRQEFMSMHLDGHFPFLCSSCNYNLSTEGKFFRYRARELTTTDVTFLRDRFDLSGYLTAKQTLRKAAKLQEAGRRERAASILAGLLSQDLENNLRAEVALAASEATPSRTVEVLESLRDVALSPENRYEVELSLGKARLRLGEDECAIANLKRAIETGLPRADAFLLAGVILADQNKPAEALPLLEQALNYGDDKPETVLHQARCLRKLGDPMKSLSRLRWCENLLHVYPQRTTREQRDHSYSGANVLSGVVAVDVSLCDLVELEKAAALRDIGQLGHAREIAEGLSARCPGLAGVHKLHAIICSELGEHELYKRGMLRERENAPKDPEVALHLARIHRTEGSLDMAAENAREAATAGIGWAYCELGLVLKARGLHKEAAEAFQREKYAEARKLSLVEAARCLTESGNADEARSVVAEIAAETSFKEEQRDELGRMLYTLQDYAEAAREFEIVLAHGGGNEEVCSMLAYSLERSGRTTEAKVRFRQLSNEDSYGHERRAWACFHLGRLAQSEGLEDEAREAYQLCLEHEPNHKEAALRLADLSASVQE